MTSTRTGRTGGAIRLLRESIPSEVDAAVGYALLVMMMSVSGWVLSKGPRTKFNRRLYGKERSTSTSEFNATASNTYYSRS